MTCALLSRSCVKNLCTEIENAILKATAVVMYIAIVDILAAVIYNLSSWVKMPPLTDESKKHGFHLLQFTILTVLFAWQNPFLIKFYAKYLGMQTLVDVQDIF